MLSFKELLEAKVTRNLTDTFPAAKGEAHFVDKHIKMDILKRFRQPGNDEMFNGKVVKEFPRKPNHFGNDMTQSIVQYDESEKLDELGSTYTPATRGMQSVGSDNLSKRVAKIADKKGMSDSAVQHILFNQGKGRKTEAKIKNSRETNPKDKENKVINAPSKDAWESESPKKNHVFINGKWAGTTSWKKTNKEALDNYVKKNPSTKTTVTPATKE